MPLLTLEMAAGMRFEEAHPRIRNLLGNCSPLGHLLPCRIAGLEAEQDTRIH